MVLVPVLAAAEKSLLLREETLKEASQGLIDSLRIMGFNYLQMYRLFEQNVPDCTYLQNDNLLTTTH